MEDGKSCNEPEQPQADSGEESAAQPTPDAQAAPADADAEADDAVAEPEDGQGGDDTDVAAQAGPGEELAELPTQLLHPPELAGQSSASDEQAEPQQAPAPLASSTAALAEKLETLERAVARLEKAVTALSGLPEAAANILSILLDRGKFDKARELAIQKMHDELKLYRDKGLQHFKKEAVENLIVLYDHFEDCFAKIKNEDNVQNSLEFLREMLLETLFREDVEPMEDLPDRVDRKRHKVVRTVRTPDPEQDLTIHRLVKRGFTWHGEVLRREHVEVRRYQQPDTASPDEGQEVGQTEKAQEADDVEKE